MPVFDALIWLFHQKKQVMEKKKKPWDTFYICIVIKYIFGFFFKYILIHI